MESAVSERTAEKSAIETMPVQNKNSTKILYKIGKGNKTMIVQHKITLEIKEKLTSSAIAYPLYAWLLSHVSKETGDALHEQRLRPISQYVYREGEPYGGGATPSDGS